MYCPARGSKYEDGDTSNFDVADGYIGFSKEFKYLGAMIYHTLTSEQDVDKRIANASAAFGALRPCIFAKKGVSRKVKGMIYSSLVISILLYGSECWSLTEVLRSRLRAFHHKCARIMCQITMHHTIKHHIKTTDLFKQLGIQSIEDYYDTRLLRWAGHVARMDFSRTPRKLLTGFLEHLADQLAGRSKISGKHSITGALNRHEIDTETWLAVAQDRHQWRILTTKLSSKRPL
jgi:hypothetical protein